MLSRHLHRQFGPGQPQRFARVVFGEVNGLGDIGVGFRPVLAYFKNQPGAEFKFALAQHIAHAEEQAGALFERGLAPAGKSLQRGLHGRFHVLLAGLLVQSDDLRGLGRIDGLDLVAGLDPLAANDEVVLPTQQCTHFLDGGAHLAGVLFAGEIDQRLVYERSFMQTNLCGDRSFNGCHERTSEIFDAGG